MISIQKRPEIRQIQPIGFRERLEASRAPTMGNARKDTKISESPTPLSASQLPGEYADWARKDSMMVATAIIKQSPASDHASQEATRPLVLLTSGSGTLALSVTTPLYSTTDSRALRRPSRNSFLARASRATIYESQEQAIYARVLETGRGFFE